jgi:predicted mannosyl-3-phosphoglycerate phosphatase (HAD superfamily)
VVPPDHAVDSRLLNALRRAGLRSVNSGRFHHVSSGADMRRSIRTLTSLYRQQSGAILTVGVSAGLADPSLLCEVDIPIVVLNPDVDPSRVLRKVPTARLTSTAGALGWDEAILSAIAPERRMVPRRRP